MSSTSGTKKLKEERKQAVVGMTLVVVEEVGLDGVEDLAGPMVTIFGKKLNKQV